ncbi:MAG: hypothetical protein JXA42_05460 [Anaerolineales bacterium]|nr:hypothetical protein [Anaerolineales bacterium]
MTLANPATVSTCTIDYGYHDPGVDHTLTGDNGVAGIVIGGCADVADQTYTNTIHGFYYITSPVINTNVPGNVELEYYRWLNSDYTPYMQDVLEVYDGSTWQTLWDTYGAPGVQDVGWVGQAFDITPYKNTNMQVRFGFNINSPGVYDVSSWNIDDISIHVPNYTTRYDETFDSCTVGADWTTSSLTNTGRFQVTGSYGTAAGPCALMMDSITNTDFNINQAILTMNLAGWRGVTLDFYHANGYNEGNEYYAYNTPMPDSFTGIITGDGVSISGDGINWHTVLNEPTSSSSIWYPYRVDLTVAAEKAGISLNSNFMIKFQQDGYNSLWDEGRGWDEIKTHRTGVDTPVGELVVDISDDVSSPDKADGLAGNQHWLVWLGLAGLVFLLIGWRSRRRHKLPE